MIPQNPMKGLISESLRQYLCENILYDYTEKS
jgi:hypothetical protein